MKKIKKQEGSHPAVQRSEMDVLQKKLADARNLLILVMPHFLPLLEVAEKRAKIAICEDVPTACTYPDGRIEFGIKRLKELSVEETAFVIGHELGHHYMATFSRSTGVVDKHQHDLVNIASDTQINNMVATYFEQNGFKKIRESKNLIYSMWWEAKRYWIIRRGISPIKINNAMTLEELSRKLLPSGKFRPIDELSMEDIVSALEIFDLKAEREILDSMILEPVLKGRFIGRQKGAFPFSIIIPDTSIAAGGNTLFARFEVCKNNPAKKVMAADLSLELTLILKNDNRECRHSFPIILSPQGQELGLSQSIHFSSDQASFQPAGESIPLQFPAEADVTYEENGDVKISGWVVLHLSGEGGEGGEGGEVVVVGEGSGEGGGNGSGTGYCPGSGDIRSRDDLKKRDPQITDEEIDKAISEMEQARRSASNLLQGDGTPLDVEVRSGLYNVPWQAYLQNWLDGHSRITRTYTRASRRGELADPRCCLPGHKRVGYRLNIVLDTSGSMTHLLPAALGAIATFCERNAVDCIKIAECDDALQAIKEISSDELRNYTAKGAGGTDMSPGMILFENDPTATAVIVITDGDFGSNSYPHRRLPYDVLWCLVGTRRHVNIPYGKQIHIHI